jgi:tetratricopeptide (TPR) repeat protein
LQSLTDSPKAALDASERALEAHPNHPLALNNSAWLHYRTRRDPELALARSERAVALEPANPNFQHTRGFLLFGLDRADEPCLDE